MIEPTTQSNIIINNDILNMIFKKYVINISHKIIFNYSQLAVKRDYSYEEGKKKYVNRINIMANVCKDCYWFSKSQLGLYQLIIMYTSPYFPMRQQELDCPRLSMYFFYQNTIRSHILVSDFQHAAFNAHIVSTPQIKFLITRCYSKYPVYNTNFMQILNCSSMLQYLQNDAINYPAQSKKDIISIPDINIFPINSLIMESDIAKSRIDIDFEIFRYLMQNKIMFKTNILSIIKEYGFVKNNSNDNNSLSVTEDTSYILPCKILDIASLDLIIYVNFLHNTNIKFKLEGLVISIKDDVVPVDELQILFSKIVGLRWLVVQNIVNSDNYNPEDNINLASKFGAFKMINSLDALCLVFVGSEIEKSNMLGFIRDSAVISKDLHLFLGVAYASHVKLVNDLFTKIKLLNCGYNIDPNYCNQPYSNTKALDICLQLFNNYHPTLLGNNLQ